MLLPLPVSRRFLILLLGIPLSLAPQGFATIPICGGHVAHPGLSIEVTPSSLEVGEISREWFLIARRLREKGIVSSSEKLEIPFSLFEGGTYSDPDTFLAAFKRLTRRSAGILYAQLVIRWSKKIAKDLQAPKLAPYLFVSILNGPDIVSVIKRRRSLVELPVAQLIVSGANPLPSMADFLAAEAGIDDAYERDIELARILLTRFVGLSAHLSESPVNQSARFLGELYLAPILEAFSLRKQVFETTAGPVVNFGNRNRPVCVQLSVFPTDGMGVFPVASMGYDVGLSLSPKNIAWRVTWEKTRLGNGLKLSEKTSQAIKSDIHRAEQIVASYHLGTLTNAPSIITLLASTEVAD